MTGCRRGHRAAVAPWPSVEGPAISSTGSVDWADGDAQRPHRAQRGDVPRRQRAHERVGGAPSGTSGAEAQLHVRMRGPGMSRACAVDHAGVRARSRGPDALRDRAGARAAGGETVVERYDDYAVIE